MMNELFERNRLLLGREGMDKLHRAKVIVFGLGGVGGYAVEALARAGIGQLTLVDNDYVSLSNRNRQIYALSSTTGRYKTEVAKARIHEINPDCTVQVFNTFYLPENADEIPLDGYDYIVDAIDTVSAKIELVVRATALNIPIISCMGTGNKLNPEQLQIDDIFHTSVCPLARVMRRELSKRHIPRLKVVYSQELPLTPTVSEEGGHVPGSVSFVPPVAGFLLASEVIKHLVR